MSQAAFKRKLTSLREALKGNARISFSQSGEDLLIKSAIDHYSIKDITYLDIGANHPVKGNNTFFFYQRGYRGVLVEPNPVLYKKLVVQRPQDICLNIGVGIDDTKSAKFYIFDEAHSAYNTFSETEMKACVESGVVLKQVSDISLQDINTIIKNNFQQPPAILSIDVESMDEAIIQSLDFNTNAPLIICTETASLSGILSGAEEKRKSLIDFILSKGYFIFADTFLNTIFCSGKLVR